jgi:hypothetical protein
VPELIHIHGGVGGSDPAFATVGTAILGRRPDEPLAAFKARALEFAAAAGEPFAVIGGLPEEPT